MVTRMGKGLAMMNMTLHGSYPAISVYDISNWTGLSTDKIKYIDGTQFNLQTSFGTIGSFSNPGQYTSTNAGSTIIVGTSNQEETDEDYTLENYDKLTLLISNVSLGKGTTLFTYTGTFRNDTNENVEVKEVGVVLRLSNASSIDGSLLVAREVLATPITLLPNESASFTLTLK